MKDALIYQGTQISFKDTELVNLTEAWRACGGPLNKSPWDWKDSRQAVELTQTLIKKSNLEKSQVWKTQRGHHGGTYAHWQIFLAYAKYLSPEFHIWANEVIRDRFEEEKNPDLIYDRLRNTYKRKGRSEEWINERIEILHTRKVFASTLGKMGCWRGKEYGYVTNQMYQGMYHMNASQLRELLNTKNPRDAMDLTNLSLVKAAESILVESIPDNCVKGDIFGMGNLAFDVGKDFRKLREKYTGKKSIKEAA